MDEKKVIKSQSSLGFPALVGFRQEGGKQEGEKERQKMRSLKKKIKRQKKGKHRGQEGGSDRRIPLNGWKTWGERIIRGGNVGKFGGTAVKGRPKIHIREKSSKGGEGGGGKQHRGHKADIDCRGKLRRKPAEEWEEIVEALAESGETRGGKGPW